MQDKFSKDMMDSARQFARFSLHMASSAFGYFAKLCGEMERELKESSARFQGQEPTSAPRKDSSKSDRPSA